MYCTGLYPGMFERGVAGYLEYVMWRAQKATMVP